MRFDPAAPRKRIDASGTYANPANNIGAVNGVGIPGQGLTPQDDWAAMFTPSPWANKTVNPSVPTPAGESGLGRYSFSTPATPRSITGASLPQMAQQNDTHAQRWGDAGLSGGWQQGNPLAILNQYQTPGSSASFNMGDGSNAGETGRGRIVPKRFRWGGVDG